MSSYALPSTRDLALLSARTHSKATVYQGSWLSRKVTSCLCILIIFLGAFFPYCWCRNQKIFLDNKPTSLLYINFIFPTSLTYNIFKPPHFSGHNTPSHPSPIIYSTLLNSIIKPWRRLSKSSASMACMPLLPLSRSRTHIPNISLRRTPLLLSHALATPMWS